ncbi:MAG: YopX family protein [[Eubacterium] siraeum]
MRERLFRGKRVDNGEWIVGGLLQDDDGKTYIVGYEHRGGIDGMIDAELILWEVIPETVGQYVELPDKNGEKIFEGDIVRDTEDFDVGKIFFDTYTAMFVIGFETTIADFNDGYSLEVIGNIYDNPELVGGRTNE